MANNSHVPGLARYSAVDRNNIDRGDLIARGIIEKDCPYSDAALANALSHMTLWNAVLETGKSACIFEDDAIICNNFVSEYEKILSSIRDDWDIILFSSNFDAFLKVSMVPDALDAIVMFDGRKFLENPSSFSKKTIDAMPVRLLEAFGLCGYALSRTGAYKLINSVIPIRNVELAISICKKNIRNESLDNIVCAQYQSMNSYVSVPPLCVTENDKSKSTMWNGSDFYL